MAEVQTNTESGEMTQRFIEFVMMQAQNAALFLGQIPNPQGDQPEINLDIARMFIDQLAMIRVKTKGNLSNEELGVLNNALSNLQMVFVEVAQEQKTGKPRSAEPAQVESPSAEIGREGDRAEGDEISSQPESGGTSGESKKKFTKSYGG